MVLTRTQRRAATAKYGSDQNEDVVPSLDLSPAPEQEAVLRDVETPAKPLMRKSSSLQALNDAARLVRTESWRHIQRQIELAATGACMRACVRAVLFILDLPIFLRRSARDALQPRLRQATTPSTSSSTFSWPSRPSSTWCASTLPPPPDHRSHMGPLHGDETDAGPAAHPSQAVTATYASYDNYPLAALFAVISVLSLFADSVAPKNRLVNSLDRIFASLGFILSPARGSRRPAHSPRESDACSELRPRQAEDSGHAVRAQPPVFTDAGDAGARRGLAPSTSDVMGAPSAFCPAPGRHASEVVVSPAQTAPTA